jgi:hypothetical protein
MNELKNKSNAQLVTEAKELAHAHEALKNKILSDLDKLTEYENKFLKINSMLKERNT